MKNLKLTELSVKSFRTSEIESITGGTAYTAEVCHSCECDTRGETACPRTYMECELPETVCCY